MIGIIEGFYGPPWSWQDRHVVCAELASAGMDTYVYAPKDDPLHRARWREPYPGEVLDEFEALAGAGSLRVGLALSPGLSMDPADAADRLDLQAKVEQLLGTGVSLLGLLFDDLEPAPGLGELHGDLVAWLRDVLPDHVELFVVPLHYTGLSGVAYLDALVARLPAAVPLGWTGRYVVNPTITAADARARAEVTGAAPLLWDNTPVNDALMARHLFTGPLRGREPGLLEHLSGYLANPMVQARASLPALLSAAAWCRGEDPEAAWQRQLGEHAVFFDGCDGAAPAALAERVVSGDQGALVELRSWFAAAELCEVHDLGDEVEPWVQQLRAEAAVGRVACDVIAAEPEQARQLAPLLHLVWSPVRQGPVEVLGGRGSLLPCFGQDDLSRWYAAPASWVPAANVVDRLVEAAFARLEP